MRLAFETPSNSKHDTIGSWEQCDGKCALDRSAGHHTILRTVKRWLALAGIMWRDPLALRGERLTTVLPAA